MKRGIAFLRKILGKNQDFTMERKFKILKRNKKGAIELDILGWWILGIVILAVMLIGYWILKSKGESAFDTIKNLLRFGK